MVWVFKEKWQLPYRFIYLIASEIFVTILLLHFHAKIFAMTVRPAGRISSSSSLFKAKLLSTFSSTFLQLSKNRSQSVCEIDATIAAVWLSQLWRIRQVREHQQDVSSYFLLVLLLTPVQSKSNAKAIHSSMNSSFKLIIYRSNALYRTLHFSISSKTGHFPNSFGFAWWLVSSKLRLTNLLK